MVPPPDDTSKSLGDGVTGSDVGPAEDSSAQSIGEGVTGSDVGPAGDSSPQSLGDRSTAGDIGSSVSDLDDLGVGLDDDLEIVDLEARYEIQNTLGRGGMGEVFRAADRRLGRDVAIKRLRGELGASRKAAERFLTEAKSIAALNHFNIVQIFDYGRASDGPFIVMEYVDGGSLAETLAKGRLEQATAVELIDQLCQALTVTQVAAASGALTWMLIEALLHKKATSLGLASGILAGLVAITPAAGVVRVGGALILGAVASCLCFYAIRLKSKLGYDDTLDVFGIHGVAGITGALLLSFLIRPSWMADASASAGTVWTAMDQFGVQLTAVGLTIAYAAVVTAVLIFLVDKVMGFRLDDKDEMAGMDHSLHGERGYGMLDLN